MRTGNAIADGASSAVLGFAMGQNSRQAMVKDPRPSAAGWAMQTAMPWHARSLGEAHQPCRLFGQLARPAYMRNGLWSR